MYILTIEGKEKEGAYSVANEDGERILYLFQAEDDATRYAMMLEDEGNQDIHVIEIEDEVILKTCILNEYKFTIITPNDIVIPPDTEHDFI
jgi:hypothetical protein|tara:strand:- start:38 stop:310 length:273 start_codon:yes stop_codon:yes gene_type:complete